MENAAFPDQIGGCEKSMHYPDDPKAGRKNSSGSASTKRVCHCEERKRRSNLDRKDCFASLAVTRSHLWGVAATLAKYLEKEGTRAPSRHAK